MVWRIIHYIKHLFFIRHRHGHGIHSPYLFEFVNGVLFNALEIKAPETVMEEHRKLRAQYAFIKRSSVSVRHGFFLYRISKWFPAEMIVEMGTGMGISSLYLASGAPQVPLHTIEHDLDRASFATGLTNRFCPGAVTVHHGKMDEVLEEVLDLMPPCFIAFVDGNHQCEPTVEYVRRLLEKSGNKAVIVLDDIYWSRGMQRAWKTIISWPEVQISLDLFHMGVLLIRRDLVKTKIKIKF